MPTTSTTNSASTRTRPHAHMATHACVAPLVLQRVLHGSHSIYLSFARFESRTCAALPCTLAGGPAWQSAWRTMHVCSTTCTLINKFMHLFEYGRGGAATRACTRSSTVHPIPLNVVVQAQSPVLNSTAWIISRAVQRRCNCSVAVVTGHPSPAPGALVLTLAINRCVV
jgi:hypothetical protein